jgi:methyl-accepting chemotaxis protein
MKGINSWRFGTRMVAGFGVVLALIVIIAAMGYRSLATVTRLTDQITDQDMVRSDIVYDIMVNNLESAFSLIPMFQEKNDEVLQKYVQPRLVPSAGSNERFKRLEELTEDPEGKALIAELNTARKGYTAVRNGTLKLLGELKREEAAALWDSKSPAANKHYREVMQKNLDFFKKRTQERKAEMAKTSAMAGTLILTATTLALLFGGLVAFLITRGLLRQLGGEPAYASSVVKRIADGDLTVEVATRANDNSSLLYAMKGMTENLERTVRGIKTAGDSIATDSKQIAAGNADLSQRTEEQASSLEETASSMEELASTVKQNADNAKQANALAATASEVAVRGGAVVGEVVQTMSSINQSSKKIADIISVIDGIAFQTNILALNAAVEAARAGEQGRGFAVVASEVRTLAQRSASAAKEIKELISDSVNKVEAGTRQVGDAGRTMEEIVSSVKRVTDIMAEIAAAAHEQSSGIEQVNQAVMQMDQVTQQNAALVEEAAAAAESLREQAQQLGQEVAVFRIADGASDVPAVRESAQRTPPAERRGPGRAQNVARLPAKVAAANRATPAAVAKTGTDGDWSEF